MKPNFCASIFFSSLLFLASSCQKQPAPKQTLSDNQIVEIMLTVDKGEIAASEVALKKQATPVVDSFARYLIKQHSESSEELTQLAKKLNIQPEESPISKTLSADGEQLVKRLEGLQGQEFDHAFVDAMVTGHRDGLHLIDTKLYPDVKNPELKAFVGQFREMVQRHLDRGLEIQKKLQS